MDVKNIREASGRVERIKEKLWSLEKEIRHGTPLPTTDEQQTQRVKLALELESKLQEAEMLLDKLLS